MNPSTDRNVRWAAGATTPRQLLRTVLEALGQGRIAEAVDQFDDHFTFNDRALGLQFADKERLREFFKKSRELFPDTAVRVVSTYESGDTAFAEWNLTATRPGYHRSVPLQMPIALSGASIATIKNGGITNWSDYYDEKSSMRLTLASFFVPWIDY
jgi:ketosteroid isomerase-like protein